MWNFNCSYMTVNQMQEQYMRNLRVYEHQRKYEKNIVCSVPERTMSPISEDVPTTERWKPG